MSKFGVVVFPGSNCDEDIIHVLETVVNQEVQRLWHKDHDLRNCDFIVLPGGFSFGDYLRSGAIAKFSPIMKSVIDFANKGGNVLGICNGFQILTESGLLPGVLLHNEQRKFECRNIFIRAETKNSLLTSEIAADSVIKIPVAHGEGNYFAAPNIVEELNDNDQVLFRYCDENGIVSTESNPNGSIQNIAGICNAGRNVFGMMPHPERAAMEILGNKDGISIFESILSLSKA